MSSNGNIPASELRPITGGVPGYPGSGMAAPGPAAAWNAVAVAIHEKTGKWIEVNGPDSAYRSYARQVYWKNYWCGQGHCENAATPGTSNHGLGQAFDVPDWVGAYLDLYGSPYGWRRSCSDAPWENWHWHWCGGWSGKDPGPNGSAPGAGPHVFKPLRRGAQGPRVLYLTRRLHHLHYHDKDGHAVPYLPRAHWNFDQPVVEAVREFQRQHKLTDDGIVGKHTRDALKQAWRHHKKEQR